MGYTGHRRTSEKESNGIPTGLTEQGKMRLKVAIDSSFEKKKSLK